MNIYTELIRICKYPNCSFLELQLGYFLWTFMTESKRIKPVLRHITFLQKSLQNKNMCLILLCVLKSTRTTLLLLKKYGIALADKKQADKKELMSV